MPHQQQPQQQAPQNLAVWSPSMPAHLQDQGQGQAHVSSGPPSPGTLNISGPLDLKTASPQPILPPIRDAHPPPRLNTPQRNASLRRMPSQNGPRHPPSPSGVHPQDSDNNPNENNDGVPHQESQPYSSNSNPSNIRSQASSPESSAQTSSSAHSSSYFDSKPSSQIDPVSLLTTTTPSSPGLQRSNSRINYSSPLLRSQSRSGSSSPSPSQQSLKRQTSILKNGSKDAPYLSSNKNLHGLSHLESLNQSWEPSGPNSAGGVSPPHSTGSQSSLSKLGSASNLRAMAQAVQAATSAAVEEGSEAVPTASTTSSMKSHELMVSAVSSPTTNEGPSLQGATPGSDSAQAAQSSLLEEPKDKEAVHIPARDSTNYKVPVPPSPVVAPLMGSSAPGGHSAFNFLNSDPTLQRSTSRRRQAPPIQVQQQPVPQHLQAAFSPQAMTSPVSPGRRHPYHRWENILSPQGGEGHPQAGREYGQGQGQDQHEDGDYEDEGGNDETDGDALSGPEEHGERRRRQQRQRAGADNVPFTPTRSAPQPPNLNSAVIPNSREAEIAHIMYIQQQQALFLQEKAMNPPLRSKGSNGNLSGGNSDGSKPRRKLSLHRKQISVISEPKLVSSTNQVKTVPIVRPADQSDDDAGTKSEYTSGGEGIKKTVRKMRRAVRHAANGVFNDDDSDREDTLGSKSDAEKKGGLKQLKALKSKLAKKLHRPSHGGGSSSRHDQAIDGHRQDEGEGGRGPVQFFSEDNLRSRYLAQGQEGGNSFAAMGASLRRSNTTRDSTTASVPMFPRNGSQGEGDKQEYESGDGYAEDKETKEGDSASAQKETDDDAAFKARAAKFGSRTFDKDEMMEVKDGTGESFFVPRWDLDPRADELESSRSVISVQSSKKLERSVSNSTVTSTKTTMPIATIAERLQGSTVVEECAVDTESTAKTSSEALADLTPTDGAPQKAGASTEPTVELVAEDEKPADVGDDSQSSPKKLAWGESILSSFASESGADQRADQEAPHSPLAESAEHTADGHAAISNSSSSGLNSRTSVVSEASSGASSVGGIVVAQVLTRQSSMRRNFKRAGSDENKENKEEQAFAEVAGKEPMSPNSSQKTSSLGLGISLLSPRSEIEKDPLQENMEDPTLSQRSQESEKQPLSLPQEAPLELASSFESKPPSIVTVRPLSPIRRGTNSLGRSSSIASMSSMLSSPSTPPASANALALPLDAQQLTGQEFPIKPVHERELSLRKSGLQRKVSLGAFTLPQAPTSPLPSPSFPMAGSPATTAAPIPAPVPVAALVPTLTPAPIAASMGTPPTAFPAVLQRQGSYLTERGSVRSMYTDSIYDYYDYDSASEHESQMGGISRQESFSNPQIPEHEQDAPAMALFTANEREDVKSGATGISSNISTATVTTAHDSSEVGRASTLAVSLSSQKSENSDNGTEKDTATPTEVKPAASTVSNEASTEMSEETPVIRLRGAGKNDEPLPYKEEHHVHYEDLPKAVPYRMSMMQTVPVDPVGVAASLSGKLTQSLSIPSRPPRHPMRQSRHGSVNTLSIGGSSDLTSESWISSARNTRDDLSGWDEGEERDEFASLDGDRLSELARRQSSMSSQSRLSHGTRSERTMSLMTDKSHSPMIPEHSEGSLLRRRGSEASSVRFPRNDAASEVTRKQWFHERKRGTWGSIQSSSSDDATSSSSRSSHFYFNGRSPSPSPTEESAPASKAF
ncbi:hypothetical protein BC939DRAFT_467472 [Gamsiella multidivaricata]|uniref:uncharacterized protein n=1 Tax=Gamsiella multidivaricata TaxID=101098 RepID=UPI00221E8BC4|nr:uncharacterized protein BC939DRAFT_467472 [Gamsiella multidivaricata]KAI7816894.1 hypothetical protein BC939DRAFT_467472 [Gamsiella multidivaricata]